MLNTEPTILIQELHKESTKTLIARLPAHWQRDLLSRQNAITARLPEGLKGNSLKAIALLSATGCTVGELEAGIHYRYKPSVGLAFKIGETPNSPQMALTENSAESNSSCKQKKRGASKTTRLETRTFLLLESARIDPRLDLLFRILADENCIQAPQHFAYRADRMTKLIRELSRNSDQLGASKKHPSMVTASCFRHQLCADLCGTGQYTANEVAEILGLSRVSTMKNYALHSKTPIHKSRFITILRDQGR